MTGKIKKKNQITSQDNYALSNSRGPTLNEPIRPVRIVDSFVSRYSIFRFFKSQLS